MMKLFEFTRCSQNEQSWEIGLKWYKVIGVVSKQRNCYQNYKARHFAHNAVCKPHRRLVIVMHDRKLLCMGLKAIYMKNMFAINNLFHDMLLPKFNINIIVTLLCLYYTLTLSAQPQNSFIEKIRTGNSWTIHPKCSIYQFDVDTTSTPNAFRIKVANNRRGVIGTSYSMFHLNRDSITVNVKIKYRSDGCSKLALYLNSFGMDMKMTDSDTLILPLNKDWTELSYSLPVKSEYALYVSIEVESQGDYGVMSIENIELFSDGMPLEEKMFDYIPRMMPDSLIKRYYDLLSSPIMDKKILAIGETIHGTQTLNELAFDIIKERVINHNCKIILLEIPLSLGLIINRYIKNDPRYSSLEFIKYHFDESLISFIPLLQWMKDYNKKNNNDITLLGIDYECENDESILNLLYFLDRANVDNRYNSLIRKLISREGYSYIDTCINNTIISDKEFRLVLHSIDKINEYKNFLYKDEYRDEKMPENLKLICDLFLEPNSTVTFYGHFLHCNYISNNIKSFLYDSPSMGFFMKNKYQSDYSCLALSANQGDTWRYDMRNKEIKIASIQNAEDGFLEYEMVERTKDSIVFIQTSMLYPNVPYKIRLLDADYNNASAYTYLIPNKFIDGFVCVSHACHLNKKPQIRNYNFYLRNYKFFCDKYLFVKDYKTTQIPSLKGTSPPNKKSNNKGEIRNKN